MYVNGIRRVIPAPKRGEKFISNKVIRERAKVRVEGYKRTMGNKKAKSSKYSMILPEIPGYDWDKLRTVGVTGQEIKIPKELMMFLSEENQIEEKEIREGKVTPENFYPSKVIKRFCTMTESEEEKEDFDNIEYMNMNVDQAEYDELEAVNADKSVDDEEDPEDHRRESSPEPEWKTKPLPKLDWAQAISDDEKKQDENEDLARMDPTMRNPSPPKKRSRSPSPKKSPRKRSRSPSPIYSEVSTESYDEEIQQMEEMVDKQTHKINREVDRLKDYQAELERLRAKKKRTKKLQLSLKYMEKVSQKAKREAKERGRKDKS